MHLLTPSDQPTPKYQNEIKDIVSLTLTLVLRVEQDRRSIDAIVIRLQWLLMTMLLQNVKQKSNMDE